MKHRFDKVADIRFKKLHDEWERDGKHGDEPKYRKVDIGVVPVVFESRKVVYTPFYMAMSPNVNKGSHIPNVAEIYQVSSKDTIKIIPEYYAILMPLLYNGKFKKFINDPGKNKTEFWSNFGMNRREEVDNFLKMANFHRLKDSEDGAICVALDPNAVLKTMVTKLMIDQYPNYATDNFEIAVEVDISHAARPIDYVYNIEIINARKSNSGVDTDTMKTLLEMRNGVFSGATKKPSSRYS